MMVKESQYLMLLFVQQRLYEGLEPDSQGYYIIQRKEFIDRLSIAPSTFDRQIHNLVNYYMKCRDLQIYFNLVGLCGESLYVDISYENGKLRFKRNPYTLRPELSYVWARKPIGWEKRKFYNEYVPVPENVSLPIEK